MEGVYPLILDGQAAGRLQVKREGAMTVFTVSAPFREGVLRLSVYGPDGEGYLGIPMPEDGQLRLVKRLSPGALRGFPTEIWEAGLAGQGPVRADDPGEGEAPAEPPCPAEEPQPEPGPEPEPESETENDGGLNWYASPDGALVCFDGERSLVALREGDPRLPGNIAGEWREIEGQWYWVFEGKRSVIGRS